MKFFEENYKYRPRFQICDTGNTMIPVLPVRNSINSDPEHYRYRLKALNVLHIFRSSFSMTPHPDNPELVLFGGEFFNGQRTTMFK